MKLAIIGDYVADKLTHIATNCALEHSARSLGLPLSSHWVGTDSIADHFEAITADYDGFLIAPGGPYRNIQAVLDIIRFARLHDKPILGTCGGFQYMILEFIRNVLGIAEAAHAEVSPSASTLVITPLTCQLKGAPLEIFITDQQSQVYHIYEGDTIQETYFCSFGLNTDYHEALNKAGFMIVGTDGTREARLLELKAHSFFIATLFVPQASSTSEKPNPMVTGFLKAIAAQALA